MSIIIGRYMNSRCIVVKRQKRFLHIPVWRKFPMTDSRTIALTCTIIIFVLLGCGGPPPPLDEIRAALKGVPTYSIIIDDMQEEGNFFKNYYHKYRVVMDDKDTVTRWLRVPQDYYQRYEPFLGMTVWSKKDGKDSDSIGPPGYEYVGDPKYGQWKTDASGSSFWEFYGKYRLFSDLLGGGLLYRNNYDGYRTSRSRGQPYYGSRKQYGTAGSVTKRQKPNFYSRRMQREQVRKSSFKDKVNSRVGRSRSNVRSRSAGWGK